MKNSIILLSLMGKVSLSSLAPNLIADEMIKQSTPLNNNFAFGLCYIIETAIVIITTWLLGPAYNKLPTQPPKILDLYDANIQI